MSKQSAYFSVPGLNGRHEIKKIKQALDGVPGVFSVSADAAGDGVAVDYDSTGADLRQIEARFREIGLDAELLKNQDHTM